MLKKVLITITIIDQKLFFAKNKPIIFIEIFVKLYNQKNHKQLYKIYGIIGLKK